MSKMKLSMAYFKDANSSFIRGNYEAAIYSYTRAIACNPMQEKYYRRRAIVHLKLKHYVEAKYDLTKALQAGSPNHYVKFRLLLAKGICCYQLGNSKEAQEVFMAGKALGCENLDIDVNFNAWIKRCAVRLRSTYAWSQNETRVIVTIPVSVAKLDDVSVPFNNRTLRCVVKNNDGLVAYDLHINLAHEINVARSSCSAGFLIRITMEKKVYAMWETLEGLQGPGTSTDSYSTNQNSDRVAAQWTDSSNEYKIEFTKEQKIEFELAVEQFMDGLYQTSPENIDYFFASLRTGKANLNMITAMSE